MSKHINKKMALKINDDNYVLIEKQNEMVIVTPYHRYYIKFVPRKLFRKYQLYINNELIDIPKEYKIPFIGFDYPIKLDGLIYHLFLDIFMFDISFNGKFVKHSHSEYLPLKLGYRTLLKTVLPTCILIYIAVTEKGIVILPILGWYIINTCHNSLMEIEKAKKENKL